MVSCATSMGNNFTADVLSRCRELYSDLVWRNQCHFRLLALYLNKVFSKVTFDKDKRHNIIPSLKEQDADDMEEDNLWKKMDT